jgi:alpha-tubulin suppressor-like RCC1 family protein
MRVRFGIVLLAVGCGGSGQPSAVAPSLNEEAARPDDAPAGPTAPAHIASGDFHSCALRGDGTVRCWGRNKEGQLGDGTTENRSTPVAVAGVSGAKQLALGANSSCALLRDHTVTCWGAGKAWGDGAVRTAQPPTAVRGVSDVTQIDSGGLLICAVLANGRVTCWGTEGEPVPTAGAVEVSAAEAHACARVQATSIGHVQCWGDSPWSGVGGPSLATPDVVGATQITTGDSMACALLGLVSTGPVVCWGRNDQGELGREPDNDWHPKPLGVPGLNQVTRVTAGEAHVCAIVNGGSVICWGSNGDGELGRGTLGEPQRPGPVPGLSGIVDLALGADHACALARDHSIACWGSNAVGQLGDGTTARRTTPARVAW